MSRRFEGFLLDYCRELTGLSTSSIKKLFAAVNDGSPRAGESLLLLAIVQGREAYLMRQAAGTSWEASYAAFLEQHEEAKLDLREFLSTLPDGNRYKKAYLAWMSQNNRLERDRSSRHAFARVSPFFLYKGAHCFRNISQGCTSWTRGISMRF